MFELHQQLQHDTIVVGQFNLCLVLLHKDATCPWLILVPKRRNVREIHHLAEADQGQLLRESSHLSQVMSSLFAPTRMNIAALGNVVPQLHLHHVARFNSDPLWPGTVWEGHLPKAYDAALLAERVSRLHLSLVGEGFTSDSGVDDSEASAANFSP